MATYSINTGTSTETMTYNIIGATAIDLSPVLDILKDNNIEEIICYLYELDFLLKVPNAEPWLINNAKEKILHYSTNKKSQE